MFPSEDWVGGTPQGQLLWGCGQGQYYGQKGALNVPSLSMRTASFIFLSRDSLILSKAGALKGSLFNHKKSSFWVLEQPCWTLCWSNSLCRASM